jgi:hypothetical protein
MMHDASRGFPALPGISEAPYSASPQAIDRINALPKSLGYKIFPAGWVGIEGFQNPTMTHTVRQV